MTNYYIPIIYIVPLISVEGQASPRLFIALEIRHEKIYSHIKDNEDIPRLKKRGGTGITASEIEQAEEFNGMFTESSTKMIIVRSHFSVGRPLSWMTLFQMRV